MVSIAIIGQEGAGKSSLAAKLGKKGTVSDITMYDSVKGEQILTIIDPSGYPGSPKSLMTALGMADIVLLCIPAGGIQAATGECIVALDLMGLSSGIVVQTMSDRSNHYELEENAKKIRTLIKGTSAETWKILPVSTATFEGMEQLREYINDFQETGERAGLPPRVVVDHSFNVRGIGSVVLGRVTRGTIHKQDKLTIHPIKRDIEIRNIQMHDVDCNSAGPGSRVGLALKGVQAKEVERGHIISESETSAEDIELLCRVSRFCPGIAANSTMHMFVGLQSAPVKVLKVKVNGGEVDRAQPGNTCTITLKAAESVSFDDKDVFVLADLNSPKQRFFASGRITGGVKPGRDRNTV